MSAVHTIPFTQVIVNPPHLRGASVVRTIETCPEILVLDITDAKGQPIEICAAEAVVEDTPSHRFAPINASMAHRLYAAFNSTSTWAQTWDALPDLTKLQWAAAASIVLVAHDSNAIERFSYSVALVKVKGGQRVRRADWKAEGKYIVLIPAGSAMFKGVNMQNCIGLKTPGKMQPGYVPQQDDMLAEDWELAED
jgi:hypothetical protein